MSRQNLGRAVGEAARLYRMWHQKDADDVHELEYPLEEIPVFRAGYLDSILYVSDKWEEDGDVYDYLHECDTGPSVFLNDGAYEEGDPSELLGTRVARNAQEAFPVLAGVKELIVVDDEGQKRSIRFKVTPMLLLCHDKKGLLVISEKLGPIYIRGGKMHVTERGIHR